MNNKGPLTDKQIAALEKNEAKEALHTLVVKIISWRDGLAALGDGSALRGLVREPRFVAHDRRR